MNIDERVVYILNILNEYGQAYLVGGALRDILRGLVPNDYDMATNIPMEDLIHILWEYNTRVISEKYNIVGITVDGLTIEIARFRKESGILDGRNPKNIEFVNTIEEDMLRRDFTVNALAYNMSSGIIDLFDGQKDLEDMVIKTVGDSLLRFEEDNLRILRALQLMSRYNFELDIECERAMSEFKNKKLKITNNNFSKYLNKILFDKYSYKALDKILKYNLLFNFIPELTEKKLGIKLCDDIVNAYRGYCKYNAYEEKSIGYAILFLYLGMVDSNKDYILKSMVIAENSLKKLDISIVDLILIKNLIYYSNIIEKKYTIHSIKRMLFEFRSNTNISKLLNLISFITYHKPKYNEYVKMTLELLSKIQAIYFNEDIVYINDLDINMVDLHNLDLNSYYTKEYIRKEIYNMLADNKLKNNKEELLKYIMREYGDSKEIKKVYSYGSIVFRYNENNEVEFLLVKIISGNWGFPKGHIEEGEDGCETAIRETKEETGLSINLYEPDKFSETISYITNQGELKYVTLYLATIKDESQSVKIDEDEISEYKWCRYEEALRIITYSSQREVLQKARLYIFI